MDTGLVIPSARPRIPGSAVQSVPGALAAGVEILPDGEAVVGRYARYTYRELDDAVTRATAVLAAAGVGTGDRVGASMANHTELVVAFFATMRLGAIWVGINTVLAPAEKQYLLADAGVSIFLGDRETAAQVGAIQSDLPELCEVVDGEPSDGESEWAQRLRAADPSSAPDGEVDPFAPAGIAYTSGTTGRPKGVVHSQHNMLMPGALGAMAAPDPTARSGLCLPLTILNLMILGPIAAFQVGRCCVLMDRVDAVGLAAWIREERVTSFAAVPAILHDLLTSPDVTPDDLATLTRPGVGGGPCPESFRRLYEERFGTRPGFGYGLTEAPTGVTAEDPSRPPLVGTSGRALPHVTITIRDEQGDVLPAGEVGEICVSAATEGPLAGVYTPMLGYWRRPDETAKALRDGVLYTGDLGYLTEEGDLFVTDRKNDLIIRGGANVYPAEVERVLHEDERVAACAVLGMPDERLGERVVAAVVLAPGAVADEDALREHCRASLARYKVPERIELVDELPRNAMGKVVKRELEARFEG